MHPRASRDAILPPFSERAVKGTQDDVGEEPIDEGTRLAKATEASYGEGIAPLSFNKGELSSSFLFVHVFVYARTHCVALVIMIM